MKIYEVNRAWVIEQEDDETFWGLDPTNSAGISIKPELRDWLNATAPGEWTTAMFNNKRVIALWSKDVCLLFKLTWKGSDVIRSIQTDMGTFYCPYVPLVISNTPNPSGTP